MLSSSSTSLSPCRHPFTHFGVYNCCALPHPQDRRLPTTLRAPAPPLRSGHLASPAATLLRRPSQCHECPPPSDPVINLRHSSLWPEGGIHTPVRRVFRRNEVGVLLGVSVHRWDVGSQGTRETFPNIYPSPQLHPHCHPHLLTLG